VLACFEVNSLAPFKDAVPSKAPDARLKIDLPYVKKIESNHSPGFRRLSGRNIREITNFHRSGVGEGFGGLGFGGYYRHFRYFPCIVRKIGHQEDDKSVYGTRNSVLKNEKFEPERLTGL
jgi:hypothetical protein